MDPLIAGYCILPFIVAFVLVFVHWDYNPGNGDLAGVFEVLVPAFVLCGIHAAAFTLHFLAAVALAALEVAFIVMVCLRQRDRAKRETEKQDRVLLRAKKHAELRKVVKLSKREAFAARVNLPPEDPIIDYAYAHLTGAARKSIQNRAQLAALVGEYAEEKQREQRQMRLFKNE